MPILPPVLRVTNVRTPSQVVAPHTYNHSAKGKATAGRFRKTPKRNDSLRKYQTSDKGRANASKQRKACFERLKEDPAAYRMRRLRVELSKLLRGQQCANLCTLLQIDNADVLRTHLEQKWQEGMSWSNYGDADGDWHVGHRIAVDHYDPNIDADLSACWCLDNLFPQWKTDNQVAGTSIPSDIADLTALYPAAWNGVFPGA